VCLIYVNTESLFALHEQAVGQIHNKSRTSCTTPNPYQIEGLQITPQHHNMSRLLYCLLSNKATTNQSSGDWA